MELGIGLGSALLHLNRDNDAEQTALLSQTSRRSKLGPRVSGKGMLSLSSTFTAYVSVFIAYGMSVFAAQVFLLNAPTGTSPRAITFTHECTPGEQTTTTSGYELHFDNRRL